MTRRRIFTATAILMVVLIAAAGFGSLVGRRTTSRFPSSFAPEPEGLLAFRRLLDEMAVPTRIETRPWDGCLPPGRTALVILTTPLQRAPDSAEIEAMRAWLTDGGTLLVMDDATSLERTDALDDLLEQAGLAFLPPLSDLDPRTLMLARPPTRAAQGTSAPPAGRDLRRLMLHRDGGLLPSSFGAPLAISTEGAIVAAEGRIGSGRILHVQGALLANDALLEGDALAFALRIVADARRASPASDVVIDEFHHGFGGVLPARHLDPTVLAWAAAQAFAVTLLYAGARGVRFRPPRPASGKPRRSSLEFVRSMGSLYRRGRARAHALEILKDRFERSVRERWSLPDTLGPRDLARATADRGSASEERIASTLAAVDSAIADPDLSEALMTRLASQMDHLEKEVLDGRRERS